MTRAVFLDRDGVLNALVVDAADGRPESPLRPEDVVLLHGVTDAVRCLRAAGYVLAGVTNQPAAAKGKTTPEALAAVHARVRELLAAQDADLDDWRMCPHRAEDGCACRKPRPGLLLDLAASHGLDLGASWMVGDTDADVAAGEAARCRTVLLETPGSAHKRTGSARPTFTAPDLPVATATILAT